MRRALAIAGVCAAAAAAGLAIAQDDPIAAMIGDRAEEAKEEAPPPAPGETPEAVAPAPEPKVAPKVTPPPKEEVAEKPVAPTRRPRYPTAILQAMDKITAESIRFEARVDQPVSYKSLVFTVRACETTAPDEPVRDAVANLEVSFRPPTPPRGKRPPVRQVYRGWMFASSPSVSPLEHPVYDAWLIACKAEAPLQPAVVVAPAVTSPEPLAKAEPTAAAATASAPKIASPKAAAPKTDSAAKLDPAPAAPEPAPAPKVEPKAAPAPPKAPERIVLY